MSAFERLWRCHGGDPVRRGIPGLQPGRYQRVPGQSRRGQPAAVPGPALDYDWGADRAAGDRAAVYAITAAERARADEQTFIAQTDVAVRFAHDATGRPILVTARMPHQQADWNPFIEPSDNIHRVQGTLREIDCSGVTTVRVEAAGQLLALAIPDLRHVQMRHAPAEFTCGPQDPAAPVIVDYAAPQGVVRGMDFQ